MNTYPRETVEFLAVTILVDGEVTTDTIQFALTPGATRPTDWIDSITLDGLTGLMISGLTPGPYRVWAKITDSPEIPVIDCGSISIT